MSVEQVEPIQQLRTRAQNLASTLDTVRKSASLGRIVDALEDIDSQLAALPGQLARARNRGYVFKNYLEPDIAAIGNEWQSTRPRVQIDADYQRRLLSGQVSELQSRFNEARALIDSDADRAAVALSAVETTAQDLQKSADTTISSLQGMYDGLESRLNRAQGEVQKAERLLDQVDQASFKLYPQENIIDAIDAQWLTDQKGGPKGILFCSDHRLLFEQKEEIATKRILFVVTEKQKVQQLAFEAPIGAVQEVKERESGALLLRKDHLDLTFGSAAKIRSAHLILKGDSAAWQKLINRINAGEMEKERVRAAEEVAPDKPRAMPTQCPACGARIGDTLVRGMQTIKCRYCGTVIPL